MPHSTMPIVGAFYRPPAALICDKLPSGTPLWLYAEPTNDYDANAVAVWLNANDVSEAAQAALEERLPDFGLTLEDFMAQEEWHLGYIPRALAAELKASGTIEDDIPFAVTFTTSNTGKPMVRFATPVL